jgi:hypothetical protein
MEGWRDCRYCDGSLSARNGWVWDGAAEPSVLGMNVLDERVEGMRAGTGGASTGVEEVEFAWGWVCARLLGREGIDGGAAMNVDATELEVEAFLLSGRIPEDAAAVWHGAFVEGVFELDTDGGTVELDVGTGVARDDAGGTFNVEAEVEATGFVGFTAVEV